MDFVNDLSTWWLRRSRERFKGPEKEKAVGVLHDVLLTLAKVIAPFLPFMAEKIYQELKGPKESVHLEDWPQFDKNLINEKLLLEMAEARKIVEAIHNIRAEHKIKVRQPLADLEIQGIKFSPEILKIILEEVNIKNGHFVEELKEEENCVIKSFESFGIKVNIGITPELKKEGILRELIRQINSLRKDAKLTLNDRISIYYETSDSIIDSIFSEFEEKIKKDTLSDEIKRGKIDVSHQKELEIDGGIWISIKKI
jgi:isoleucyl-tRNA synthetase